MGRHCDNGEDHGQHEWHQNGAQRLTCYGTRKGWVLPHPEVIKADPSTCSHGVLDEMAGVQWGFEDCVTCGKRFPMRSDSDDYERSEP